MRRLHGRAVVVRVIVIWLVTGTTLLLFSAVLDGFEVSSFADALAAAALIGLLNALVWPLVIRFALPITVLTLGLGVLVLNGAVVWVVAEIAPGVTLDSVATGVVVAIAITAVNTAATSLLAIDDDDFYFRNVIRREARRGGAAASEVPALYFLEIDGLSHGVLMRALRDGNAPTMARWLADGSHHLFRWECDWSSQTGAAQTGLLHGTNEDIPAFRWWDKEAGREVSSSRPRDVTAIERRISDGRGLLHADGASRANMYSGDAPHSLLTMSTVLIRDRPGRLGGDYFAYFANPYNLTRTISLVLADIVSELWQAAQQRRRDVRPRVHRGLTYAFVRAWTTVVQRDLQVAAVIGDIYAGRPVLYTTFTGYDEVAHHSGIERPETLKVLRKLDRQFARIEHAAEDAPRPVRLVVLSDHGQTQGATFRDRYGESLRDLVTKATSADSVRSASQGDEGLDVPRRLPDRGVGRHGRPRELGADGDAPQDGRRRRRPRRRPPAAWQARRGRRRRGRAPRGRRAGLGLPRPRVLPARARPGDPRVDRRALPATDPDAPRPSRRRVPARPLGGSGGGRARGGGDELPRRWPRRGRGSACPVRAECREARRAHRRVRPLRRPDDQLDLLGRDGGGGGVRGARRLPRRSRRRAVVPLRVRAERLRSARGDGRRTGGDAPVAAALARRPRPGGLPRRWRSRLSGGQVTYCGHATVLIELDGVRLLTDPVLRRRLFHLRRIVPGPLDPGALDGILVSHAHWDHLDLPTLRRLDRSVPVVCPRGVARRLRRFAAVSELDVGARVSLGPLEVRATPAEHDGRRGPFDRDGAAIGFLVTGSRRIYFAGDTDLFAGMGELAPGLDLALLPVAGWGARLGPGHLDPGRAAEAARLLRPRLAVPIHWGTLRPLHERADPAARPAEEFRRRAAELAPDVAVRILEPGETLELS